MAEPVSSSRYRLIHTFTEFISSDLDTACAGLCDPQDFVHLCQDTSHGGFYTKYCKVDESSWRLPRMGCREKEIGIGCAISELAPATSV